jgi:hypothetical protein
LSHCSYRITLTPPAAQASEARLAALRAELEGEAQAYRTLDADLARHKQALSTAEAAAAQVRKTPSWPRSWANFSLF